MPPKRKRKTTTKTKSEGPLEMDSDDGAFRDIEIATAKIDYRVRVRVG